jgi:hypothetical protein
MKTRGMFILCHQGLGDHILCNGIYRDYAREFKRCVIPVTDKYYITVSRMLSDVKNIQIVKFKNPFWSFKMEAHANLLNSFGYDTLRLGVFGVDFFQDSSKRLDDNYYSQAGLLINKRWDSFKLVRNNEAEDTLFRLLVGDRKEYIFLHEDEKRNYLIDHDLLPKNAIIVKPIEGLNKKFSFFDYLKIIENAKEIHCIESSFAALIESLEYSIPKYAHRYARPEAKNDLRHEFTYRSNWHVYK